MGRRDHVVVHQNAVQHFRQLFWRDHDSMTRKQYMNCCRLLHERRRNGDVVGVSCDFEKIRRNCNILA